MLATFWKRGARDEPDLAAIGLVVTLVASGASAAAEKDNDPLWVLMIGAGGECRPMATFKAVRRPLLSST